MPPQVRLPTGCFRRGVGERTALAGATFWRPADTARQGLSLPPWRAGGAGIRLARHEGMTCLDSTASAGSRSAPTTRRHRRRGTRVAEQVDAAERTQHLIAGRVSQSVVDLLEVVEVQHDHGVAGGEPAEGTIEHPAVGKAGQLVGRRGLGEPLVPAAELQDMPGVEQEGRQVPVEEGTGGTAEWGRGQQRLTVTERDVDRDHARVVRSGRDQLAAELADQVLGDAPGVAAGTQPEQGTRRLVHRAPGTWWRGSAGVFVSWLIRGPHPAPQHGLAPR